MPQSIFGSIIDARSPSGTATAGAKGLCQGRLDQVNVFTLRFAPAVGPVCEIGGEVVYLPAAGFLCLNTDLRILATGLAAAGGPNASTTYYAYVSNSQATYAPLSLRLSAIQPTSVEGTGYLGASGNAFNWRYVGLVRMTSATEFADNPAQRYVSSFYNRRASNLYVNPGYVDDGANTFLACVNGAGWRPWPATATVEFLALGDEAVLIYGQATFAAAAAQIGFGIRNGTDVLTAGVAPSCTDGTQFSIYRPLLLARGFYTLEMTFKNGAGAPVNCYADFARDGADQDVPASYLTGVLFR